MPTAVAAPRASNNNTITADEIRAFVLDTYLRPARRQGKSGFSVRIGDLMRDLPQIRGASHPCAALRSPRLFLRPNGLELVQESGAKVGHSTELQFAFVVKTTARNTPVATPSNDAASALIALYGVGSASYRAHGGGDAVLARVREGW
jgi:hypothetical protein